MEGGSTLSGVAMPEDNTHAPGQDHRSNIPIPDPSLLTTAALEREIGHLRELFSRQIEDIVKDVAQFQDNHDQRHRDVVTAAIEHLKELCEVKFRGVQTRFEERDLRFAQRDVDASEAIRAALSAAKEAVAKSEMTFTKEIDSIKALIATTAKAQDQQIRDIKNEQVEARGKGAGLSQAWGVGIASITVLIGIISVIIIMVTR